MDQNQNNPPKNDPKGKRPKANVWVTLIITVAIILIISAVYNAIVKSQYTETTYSEFMDAWESGQLDEVELHYDRVYYLTKEEAAKPAGQQKACYTGLPNGDILALAEKLDAQGITVNQVIVEDNSGILLILYYVIGFAMIFFVLTLTCSKPKSYDYFLKQTPFVLNSEK